METSLFEYIVLPVYEFTSYRPIFTMGISILSQDGFLIMTRSTGLLLLEPQASILVLATAAATFTITWILVITYTEWFLNLITGPLRYDYFQVSKMDIVSSTQHLNFKWQGLFVVTSLR